MIAADSSIDAAALARARLLAHAEREGIRFDRVLFRYTLESVLRRLARSSLGTRIALVGGTALAAHLGADPRQLARLEIQLADVEALELLPAAVYGEVELAPDGLLVDTGSMRSRELEQGEALTRRVTALARLGTAVIPVRIDGEVGEPPSSAEMRELRSVLPGDKPVVVQVVGLDTVFAEAMERLVRRGPLQARMCDVFDAWMCTQVDPLDDVEEALTVTFRCRGMGWPRDLPHVLSNKFAMGRHAEAQWQGFVTRYQPTDDVGVVDAVATIRQVWEETVLVTG